MSQSIIVSGLPVSVFPLKMQWSKFRGFESSN